MSSNDRGSVSYFDIDLDNSGQRIDNWLKRELKGVPTSLIYRILRKGEVRVNKKRVKPEYKLQAGDVLRLPPIRLDAKKTNDFTVGDKLKALVENAILFEDKHLIVLNKPSGLAVHGGSGLNYGAIEALRQIRPELKQLELVHRLDRDTSGCLVIAKKRSVLRALHEQLRNKQVDKRYWALVSGAWPARLKVVEKPLFKNVLASGERMVRVDAKQGKPSETRFKIIQKYQGATLVEAFPVTGRTHQIRVHAAASGFPIALDDKYGEAEFDKRMKPLGINRLFLHAASISFIHPKEQSTLRIEAPLDNNLLQALERLKRA
ncbi:23S rRNA pseudouridylate synthase C [Catenovulum agarivorans DS-2]|uniref:Pseudouridine synthase n=1 Tax=Catenovulum agarivorans DS-2 TaxID=1328313 RepID=W7QLA2_9ALTE|nr:23S rRNA pseudouridine(955/2504/2580) synthase RluC [Catenovulum agarivorans]EWH09702.1 23S rRNA pseudouridylate synthase C [Catenovulum agarivorans DS-2]